MSRTKKIRKEINKNNQEVTEEITFNKAEDFVALGKIVFIIVLVLGLAYVYTRTFITKDWNEPEVETPDVEINYNDIIAEQALSQKDNEYYVLYVNAASKSLYSDYVKNITSKKIIPMYTVDTTSFFNEYVRVEDDYTTTPENIDELRVGTVPTLIKVVEGKVVEFVEEDVEAYLEEVVENSESK